MEAVLDFIRPYLPENTDPLSYLRFLLIFILSALILGYLFRLIFGKRSNLNYAVSSAIAIVCMYVVNIVIYSSGAKLDLILSPLPFVSLKEGYLHIFPIFNAGFGAICSEVLDMVILAFLMNLLETWLPKGEKVWNWYFFRLLSVVLAICLYCAIHLLLDTVVPVNLAQIAPTILLIILIAMLLLGCLKLLVGTALAFINPILGALYAFFFANVIGRQISRAVLTTLILTALVCLLNYLDITAICVASAALLAYLPLILIALVLWYVIGHLL